MRRRLGGATEAQKSEKSLGRVISHSRTAEHREVDGQVIKVYESPERGGENGGERWGGT